MTDPSDRSIDMPDYDADADTNIDTGLSEFYEGITVSNLEAEDFENFWDALDAKNRRHFTFSQETGAGVADSPNPLLSIGGFDASSQLPGFGLLSLEISAEEAEPKLNKLFEGKLNHSEIYRRTMEMCMEPQDFSEVEEAIQTFPEYPLAAQSPYRFIKTLIEAGGLRRISLDAQGEEVTAADVEGLTEDEIDDMVERFVLQTTEAGRAITEEHAPRKRLRDLMEKFPDRASVYRDLLDHVKSSPCNYAEIEQLFAGRDFSGLRTIGMEKKVALKPSVFVNNMEKAGGMVWKDGRWTITREGEALLQKLLENGTLG